MKARFGLTVAGALVLIAGGLRLRPVIADVSTPGAAVIKAIVQDQGLRYCVAVPDGWQIETTRMATDPAPLAPTPYTLLYPQGQKDGPVNISITVLSNSAPQLASRS